MVTSTRAVAAAMFVLMACDGVTGAGARELISKRRAQLVDVRSVEEYAAGHLAGAINVPVETLPSNLAALPNKDQDIIVYCRSGARSARAAEVLKQAGFTRVHDLGPMSNW